MSNSTKKNKPLSKTALDKVEFALKLIEERPEDLKHALVKEKRYASAAKVKDIIRLHELLEHCPDDKAQQSGDNARALFHTLDINVTSKEGYMISEAITLLYKYDKDTALGQLLRLKLKAESLFPTPEDDTCELDTKYPGVKHMILVEGGRVPSVQHTTLGSAMDEADRLVRKENRPAKVVSILSTVVPGDPIHELHFKPSGEE